MCVREYTHVFIHVCTKAGIQGESKVVGSGAALSVRNRSKLMMKNTRYKREKWVGETHTQRDLPEKGVMKCSGISLCSTPDTTCKPSRAGLGQCLQDRPPRTA